MTNQRIAKQRFGEARALFLNEAQSQRKAVALVGVFGGSGRRDYCSGQHRAEADGGELRWCAAA